MAEGVELTMINHKVEDNPCDFDGCGRPSYWFDGTYARCKSHGLYALKKTEGIEYKKGEMQMTDEEITAAFNELQKRKRMEAKRKEIEFQELHSQCQGSQCQNSDYPKYVHKDAPDHPYCNDCATENAMIDRRDWTAVRLVKGLSQSDAFEKLHGCAI